MRRFRQTNGFSGRQDADLYGRRDARRYNFRQVLKDEFLIAAGLISSRYETTQF
jgi:hypothetical protein